MTTEPMSVAAEPQAPQAPQEPQAPRVPADSPPAARGRRGGPALQGLLALALYLVIWLAAGAWPLLVHPGNAQLEQKGMDPNFYVWALRWWPYALAHGLNPLHSSLVQVPNGLSLAWITTIPPLAVLAAPVTVLAGPVVAFNLLVVASLPVSAWAAFVLCRRITGGFWASLAGGAVYGFSAYEMNHIAEGQLNLSFSPFLPLMAYLVVVWWERKIRPSVFVGSLALLLAAQFYLFIETFADLTVVLVAALGAGYLLAGRPGRAGVAKLAGLTGLAYLLAIVIAAPLLWAALTQMPPGFVRDPTDQGLDLMGLVIARHAGVPGLSWLAPPHGWHPAMGKGAYIGVALLLIAVILALSTWSRKLTRFLTVMLAFVIVAALGPGVRADTHELIWLPWRELWYLPIIRSSFPTRLMIFASLVLAVIVAVWLAGPRQRPSPGRWRVRVPKWTLALAAIGALLASGPALPLTRGTSIPAFITSGRYRQYLRPGATIVVISRTGNAGLLWQAETDFYPRLAGGFLNEVVTLQTDLPLPVADLVRGKRTKPVIRRFRVFMRQARVSAIFIGPGTFREWPRIFAKLGLRREVVGNLIVFRPASRGASRGARQGRAP